MKPATDEEIAKWRISVPIEPFYGSVWICKGCAVRWDANEYESIPHMDYCLSELGPRIKARLEADREENAANAHLIAQGIKVVNEQAAEIAALKADQADWRKGVGFIASALGIDSLSCVDIAERGLEIRAERDALKAEVERPRCNDLLCRCCARRAR